MFRSPRFRIVAEVVAIALLSMAAVYCTPSLDNDDSYMMQDSGD